MYQFYPISLFVLFSLCSVSYAQPQKVWLDADTGNEMDDVWAVVRLLWAHDDEVEVVGLSSAHFNNPDLLVFEKWNQYPTEGIHPLQISQALNVEILQTMGLENIPHPEGADRMMGRSWGGTEPRPSPATDAMWQVVESLAEGEKLDILSLGALTNVASLIALHPEAVDRIRLYSMGLRYNAEEGYWSKNEFNGRRDLNAVDFLFDQPSLDWTIIPVQTCLPYRFDRDESYARFADDQPVEHLMEDRWRETNPQDQTRILWDLALVQAYLLPDEAEVQEVMTPPENHQHRVKVYTDIDIEAFFQDFWGTMESQRLVFQRPQSKPRLGEVHYGNRVGGLIGQEGPTRHLIFLEEGDRISELMVSLTPEGTIVKGFRLMVAKADGSTEDHVFGKVDGGTWQAPYPVPDGAELVGIAGAAGWYIDRLRFLFNDGSESPTYGGPGGDNAFELKLATRPDGTLRGRMMGFWGSWTDVLETIGLVFWPLE